MKLTIAGLVSAVLLLLGFINHAIPLIALGGVGLAGVLSYLFYSFKKKKHEKELEELATFHLNQYLKNYDYLKVSDHVSIKRKGELLHLEEALVYYDDQCIATLKDFMEDAGFDRTMDQIEAKIKEVSRYGDMIDENHNGIDDRFEEANRAQIYITELTRFSDSFTNLNINAGLKAICEQLRKIGELETKYPQISSRTRKLYQHYLPLLMNILNQYQGLVDKKAASNELTLMEQKLEKSILLVSEALKTIMTSFISEDVLNLSTDMTVLEAALKKDGLVSEGGLSNAKQQ